MNNIITKTQWEEIIKNFQNHCKVSNIKDEEIYFINDLKGKKRRLSIYDNYDRWCSPGLDFVFLDGEEEGRLTVYNNSEMSYAPITFEEGIQISSNFFNDYGSQISEEIVCDHVIDNGQMISIFSQISC